MLQNPSFDISNILRTGELHPDFIRLLKSASENWTVHKAAPGYGYLTEGALVLSIDDGLATELVLNMHSLRVPLTSNENPVVSIERGMMLHHVVLMLKNSDFEWNFVHPDQFNPGHLTIQLAGGHYAIFDLESGELQKIALRLDESGWARDL